MFRVHGLPHITLKDIFGLEKEVPGIWVALCGLSPLFFIYVLGRGHNLVAETLRFAFKGSRGQSFISWIKMDVDSIACK